MGVNSSKAISNITTKISNELTNTAGASSTAQCSITTGNIQLKNSKRCSVVNDNKCGASASAAISSVSKVAAEEWMKLSNDQKTSLLPGISISESEQNVQTEIQNRINNACQANSRTTMEIATKDILVDGCEDSVIRNVNTGNAQANCGITTVLDAINKTYTEQQTTQSTGDIFGSLFQGLGSIGEYGAVVIFSSVSGSIVCCCLIIILILFMFFPKQN
jgi:hypothetical protein